MIPDVLDGHLGEICQRRLAEFLAYSWGALVTIFGTKAVQPVDCGRSDSVQALSTVLVKLARPFRLLGRLRISATFNPEALSTNESATMRNPAHLDEAVIRVPIPELLPTEVRS